MSRIYNFPAGQPGDYDESLSQMYEEYYSDEENDADLNQVYALIHAGKINDIPSFWVPTEIHPTSNGRLTLGKRYALHFNFGIKLLLIMDDLIQENHGFYKDNKGILEF